MADVASNLFSWSTTASSNSPSGGTTIGSGLDDNLREMQAVIRAALAHKGSDISSSTTTDVGAVAGFAHDITGTTTITGLGTVSAGIHKILKFEGALTLTHNATSLILPGAANITTADGDVGWFISEGSGNWRCLSYVRANGGGVRYQLGSIRTYTSTDTWTLPAGCRAVLVKVQAPGGGGGGADNTAGGGTTTVAAGGGGGAGGYVEKFITSGLGATETVTIGSVGSAGADTGTTGGTGGATSFGGHCTATGGVGGVGTTGSSGGNSNLGGNAGLGANGTVNIQGGYGFPGLAIETVADTSGTGAGGNGGTSVLGGGGPGGVVSASAASSAGMAGHSYGGGGGGAVACNTPTGAAGGAGGAGIVIVFEFF